MEIRPGTRLAAGKMPAATQQHHRSSHATGCKLQRMFILAATHIYHRSLALPWLMISRSTNQRFLELLRVKPFSYLIRRSSHFPSFLIAVCIFAVKYRILSLMKPNPSPIQKYPACSNSAVSMSPAELSQNIVQWKVLCRHIYDRKSNNIKNILKRVNLMCIQ